MKIYFRDAFVDPARVQAACDQYWPGITVRSVHGEYASVREEDPHVGINLSRVLMAYNTPAHRRPAELVLDPMLSGEPPPNRGDALAFSLGLEEGEAPDISINAWGPVRTGLNTWDRALDEAMRPDAERHDRIAQANQTLVFYSAGNYDNREGRDDQGAPSRFMQYGFAVGATDRGGVVAPWTSGGPNVACCMTGVRVWGLDVIQGRWGVYNGTSFTHMLAGHIAARIHDGHVAKDHASVELYLAEQVPQTELTGEDLDTLRTYGGVGNMTPTVLAQVIEEEGYAPIPASVGLSEQMASMFIDVPRFNAEARQTFTGTQTG